MKENSIERDIHLLESYAGMTHKMNDNQGRPKLDQAIEHILSEYKRVLKENEEFKEYNMEYKRILDLADNRIYRKKYLEERRKEQPNLLYPDGDEIYQRYYELKEENEHNKLLLNLNNNFTIDKKNGNYKWNVIEIQKIKDKIEELNKEIKSCAEIDAIFKIKQQQILQELLESEE